MRETWYVLTDGRFAVPDVIAPDEDGVLRHLDRTPVAIGPHGPVTRSMSAEEIAALREVPISMAGTYKNRQAKVR